MREIKFRGKRIDTGEWIYGDICHHDGKVSYIGQHLADGAMVVHDLIPETVGQYVDLHDKHGKPIYEGDIVKILNADVSDNIFVVEMSDGKEYGIGYGLFTCFEHEVIGDIYSTPELLVASHD